MSRGDGCEDIFHLEVDRSGSTAAALVAARLAFAKQWRWARARAREATARQRFPGLDSEFYVIEKRLASLGLGRHDGETLSSWLARLRAGGFTDTAALEPALGLRYRLRFDPQGISAGDRKTLRGAAECWLAERA